MTLNASGPISIAGTTAGESIQIELGGNGTTQMSLDCASVRTLAGVPTGAIVMPTCFYGKSNAQPFGCATYGTPGTYSFTVPSGITKISVVCVGAGGGGINADTCCSYSGNGGAALSYTNCIPVTPAETLTVVVGAGGLPCDPSPGGLAGGPSSVSRGPTTLILASGTPQTISSQGRNPGASAASGTGAVRYSGGSAGNGGGGAAGYAGDGGAGGGFSNFATSAGSGGGGGGGGGAVGSASSSSTSGSGGGGVGLVVQGSNGAAGTNNPNSAVRIGGGGGSGGSPGTNTNTGANQAGRPGGAYGGGAGGGAENCGVGGTGASGGVRIIYGGIGKSYPNNSAP